MNEDFFPEAEETIADAAPTKGLAVKDDVQADIQIEKLKELRRDKERLESIYEGKKKLLEAQFQSKIEGLEKQEEYISKALEGYFTGLPSSQLKASKSSKSYKLLSGTLRTKEQAPELTLDEEKVIPWLEKNGGSDYIKTKKTVDKTMLKKAIIIDGEKVVYVGNHEPIDGAESVKRPDKFIIE